MKSCFGNATLFWGCVGWGDISVIGDSEIHGISTPNIDSLASEGIQMTRLPVILSYRKTSVFMLNSICLRK